jgi:uroporphyrinogen decarboxylase
MTYDTVSFEAGIAEVLPGHGAIYGGMAGPIQNRQDFERYPWHEITARFWARYDRQYSALRQALPPGMKAIGGVGYGVFEVSEDLVGYEGLSYMQIDDPGLFAELYRRIGELMANLWREFLVRYGDSFVVCRMGDDLGYKTGLLMDPATLREHVVPQYRNIISIVHDAGKPFLWHSCGRIFEIMDDVIAAGIDAKHSNEDVIAPYDEWIERYSGRIALFGGIDMDHLCQKPPDEIRELVTERGARFRAAANGYALGSGNSIPDYVPAEGYLALVEAAHILREQEI